MAESSAVNHDAAIGEYQDKLRECTMEAKCGREYVLVGKLTTWLRSRVRSGSNATRAGRLLHAAYRKRSTPGYPISTDDFKPGGDCCLLVFCILLVLGSGELIESFTKQDKVDTALPIPWSTLRELLEAAGLPNARRLASAFDEIQWRFCAARFDLYKSREYSKNTIIPLCGKEKINSKGGTADLWVIDVQEEFVNHRLRQVVPKSRYNFNNSKDDPDWRYQFALKSFGDHNRTLYRNEKDAFLGLRNHEGMVRYLADYGHKEIVREEIPPSPHPPGAVPREDSEGITKTTFNILLEYGEMDLDEFFAERLPPVLQIEVEAFWKALFEVAEAVEGIHNLEVTTDEVVQKYHGWHADIKPDNILSVKEKFKLADPGFAKFVKKRDKAPKEFVLGGTETYGAPECHPGRRGALSAVSQTIDIWSLGCVFSIAATWVVLGYQGIRQFQKMRENAIDKIIRERPPVESSRKTILGLSAGDHFHDGRRVLADVSSWHLVLRSALRKTDSITSQVLDLVDQELLLDSAKDRIKAADLCPKLAQTLTQSQKEPRAQMPESIMAALLEVDEDASSKALQSKASEASPESSQSQTVPYDRKSRKSKLRALPLMKTTHRKSAWIAQSAAPGLIYDSPLEKDKTPSVRLSSGPRSSSPRQPRTPLQQTIPQPFQNNEFGRVPSGQSIISVSTRRPQLRNSKSLQKHAPQGVVEAHEEAKGREKHNYFHRPRTDPFLTQYIRKRDIKFLVDNAESMKAHWSKATFLLETLVMKAAGQDKNGMDLAFTAGSVKIEKGTSASKFRSAMEKAKPLDRVHTDMRQPLGDVFDAYIGDVEAILPNQRMKNANEVDQKIICIIKRLEPLVTLKHRPFSIEFIQFGNDEDATYRLRRLDNDLKWDGIPDIVDTEPESGDVNKMLLGSFVEEYDEDEDDDGRVNAGSPLYPADPPESISSPTRPSTNNGIVPTGLSPRPSYSNDSRMTTPIASPPRQHDVNDQLHQGLRHTRSTTRDATDGYGPKRFKSKGHL